MVSFLNEPTPSTPKSFYRLDFPDADASAMYVSMQKLRTLPDDVVAYPGHNYGGFLTTVGQEKRRGVLAPISWSDWQLRFTQPR